MTNVQRSAANKVVLPPGIGQVVLVLQGGGALGAYQVGVYQALHEAGIEPDWVIGTSIGAINASLIAGNEPADRMTRLQEFWRRVEHGPFQQAVSNRCRLFGAMASKWLTMAGGIPSFFKPNPFAFSGAHVPLGADVGWLLFHCAARGDAERSGRLRADQSRRDASDSRCGERSHQRDALLRQP